MISLFSEIETPVKVKTWFPLLEKTVQAINNSTKPLAAALLKSLTPESIKPLFNSKKGRQFFTTFQGFLKLDKEKDQENQELKAANAIWLCSEALKIVTPVWFSVLGLEQQKQIVHLLLDLLTGPQPDLIPLAKEVLMKITLSHEHLLEPLTDLDEKLKLDSEQPAKKMKKDFLDHASDIYLLTQLLEIIEIKKLENIEESIPTLFSLLQSIVELGLTETFTGLDYVKQLLLAVFHSIFSSLVKRGLSVDEKWIHVDAIIQCIRVSQNVQCHQSAFLVLADIGALYPELIQKSVMPIFTFMGANILRQDDEYSFKITEKSMEVLIPALMSRSSDNGKYFKYFF
jgi:U3 small nucleolar RNA-associated protein 10